MKIVTRITSKENPIPGGDDPFGSNFDASIIWAPVMGRLIYTGIRLKNQLMKLGINNI